MAGLLWSRPRRRTSRLQLQSRSRSRSPSLPIRSRRADGALALPLGRAVEDDRIDKGEADQAVLRPFDYCGNENSALETDVHFCSGHELGRGLAHHSALGNILKRKARRRAIDQELELATLG